jgi:type IV pilus assembly protein PilA
MHMRKATRQSGFTIIEIMIVVTVIGVISAIVMPTFRLNTVRAKVSEAILAFGTCKTMISEIYITGGVSPGADNWDCESGTSQYVKSIKTTDEGIIRVELQGDQRLNLFEIALAPIDNAGNVVAGPGISSIKGWRCGNANDLASATYALNPKYLPNSCRGY